MPKPTMPPKSAALTQQAAVVPAVVGVSGWWHAHMLAIDEGRRKVSLNSPLLSGLPDQIAKETP
jgi:hypothetical protein